MRHITLILSLTLLGASTAYSQTYNLEGVTVTGSYIVNKGDNMIIHLPESIKKNTFDGYAALQALSLPGLRIDPIEYTVTSNTGDVMLCINGREADVNEIRTLAPQHIKRINYYPNFDPNHPAANAVIDFIIVNPDSGGIAYGNAKHNINIGKGDGILDLKHYKSKSELNFQLSGNYGSYTQNRGEESTTNMTFDDGAVTKTSEVRSSPQRSNSVKGKVSWLKQGKRDMFQMAAYLNRGHEANRLNMSQSYSTMSGEILTQDYTHKDNISPAAQIYYQKILKGNGMFRANIYGNYSHTDKEREYNSTSSFQADTKEDMFCLRPNLLVGLNMGWNRPFIYAAYDYKRTKNKYTESGAESDNKLTYGNGLFTLGNNFIFSKKFRITLQLSENVLSVDDGKDNRTKCFFSPSLLYNANLGHGNTIRGELYSYVNDPQMGYYNGSSQRMDQYQILRGNPELKNGHCAGIESTFDSNHRWGMFELFTQYINMPKYIYEDVLADNDNGVFVHTYKNGKSYNHFLLNAEVRLNVIPKRLVWMVAGEYDLFKEEYRKINEFVAGTDLTYTGNNLIGKVELTSPIKYLTKGVEYKKPTSLRLSLRYTIDRLQIGFSATNPLMHSFVKTTYTADRYYNAAKTYSPRIASNMYMLTLSYRMSYGKKHKFQNIEMDDSQSSGLLEQQNIRNEEMERGKR
jgi:hypothetical protein